MSLNLFPARVAIGVYTASDGSTQKVYPSDEFFRALGALFDRVGGPNGMDINSLALLAAFAVPPGAAPDGFSFDEFTPAPAAVETMDWEGGFRAAPDYAGQRDIADLFLDRPPDQSAMVAELAKQVQDLRAMVDSLVGQAAAVNEVRKYAQDLEISYSFAPSLTDWEHPGSIGAKTPAPGAFTTVSATGQITSTVSGGTAPFVVASSTVVGNLNVSQLLGGTWAAPGAIGSGTAASGAFTSLNATGDFDMRGGTATNIYLPNNASIRFKNAAGTTRQFINWFTDNNVYYINQDGNHIFQCGAGASTEVTISTSGIKVQDGFGCNTKTPQTAYASGGALAAYGAGANGFDTGANASALHAMVVAIRAALVANGIMS